MASSSIPVFELVKQLHAAIKMDGFRLYFAGKEVIEETRSFSELGIPNGALLRIDEAETPRDGLIDELVAGRLPDQETEEDTETEMVRVMGFSSFSSSKGQCHKHSDCSYARINKTPQYRQFMKRKGGTEKPVEAQQITKKKMKGVVVSTGGKRKMVKGM